MWRSGRVALAAAAGVAAGMLVVRARRKLALEGRVALVTGGSRGLGLLIAEELARRGARVIICARDEAELERAREILGPGVTSVACDLTDRAQLDALVTALGPIDILVNNAAVIHVGPVDAMSRADFDLAMATNFRAAADLTLALLPGMKERRRGRIVNVTSIGGEVAVPHLLPYDAAKFALVGFSQGLRSELVQSGIYVTTVVPWLMRTGSAVHATFKGDPVEPTLFAAGAALPTAISPRRAARRIVRALIHGEAHVTLGFQAKLTRLAYVLAPGFFADVLAQVTRFLPERIAPARSGAEAMADMPRPLASLLRHEGAPLNELTVVGPREA